MRNKQYGETHIQCESLLRSILTGTLAPSTEVMKALKENGVTRSTFLTVKKHIGVNSIKEPGFQARWMMTLKGPVKDDDKWPTEPYRLPVLHGRWTYTTDRPGIKSPSGKIYRLGDTINMAELAAIQDTRGANVLFWCNEGIVICKPNKGDFDIEVSEAVKRYKAITRITKLERTQKANRLKARVLAKNWLKDNCTYPHKVTGRQIADAANYLNISRRTMEQAKSDLGIVRFKVKGGMAYQMPRDK